MYSDVNTIRLWQNSFDLWFSCTDPHSRDFLVLMVVEGTLLRGFASLLVKEGQQFWTTEC